MSPPTEPVDTSTTITRATSGAEETREFGREIAGFLQPGDLVLLEGGLGAGKTTFVQGIASGLGITESVTSPTFTLMRIYEINRGPADSPPRAEPGPKRLLHADLYRLEHLNEVLDLGMLELIDEAVCVVEWGEAGTPVFGGDHLEVRIERPAGADHNERLVTLAPNGSWVGRRLCS
jgi:tRNA threonylcarbamoyladenosine biosynthesis protein TsaE